MGDVNKDVHIGFRDVRYSKSISFSLFVYISHNIIIGCTIFKNSNQGYFLYFIHANSCSLLKYLVFQLHLFSHSVLLSEHYF
jgi:hypothetical protein